MMCVVLNPTIFEEWKSKTVKPEDSSDILQLPVSESFWVAGDEELYVDV